MNRATENEKKEHAERLTGLIEQWLAEGLLLGITGGELRSIIEDRFAVKVTVPV